MNAGTFNYTRTAGFVMNPLLDQPLIFLIAGICLVAVWPFVCAVWQFRSLSFAKKYLAHKANLFFILGLAFIVWDHFHPALAPGRFANALIFSAGLAHLSFSALAILPQTGPKARQRALIKLPFLGLLVGLVLFSPQMRAVLFLVPMLFLTVFLFSQRENHRLAFRSALFMSSSFLLGLLLVPEDFSGPISWARSAFSALFFLMSLVFYDQNLNYFLVRLFIVQKTAEIENA